ncbi:MAG: prolipoprotein diacylglyceryl transferase [Syntrophomonas sp.]|nr:prolipoprotein diacylglyceryl transferase [Syntrophomonas sp.]
MHPVLIDLGRIKVHSWGFMLALAVIVAIVGIGQIFKKEGYDPEKVLDMVIILVLTGLLGSRLAYIAMFEWQEFLGHPGIFFSFTNGGFSGLVWYGGFTASILAFIIYIYRQGLSFWKMADIFAPFLALGYALVRIGCFLNGCCYGKVSESSLAIVFPLLDELSRHPTQLYSSAINCVLFGVLLWYYPRRRFNGQIFIYYLLGYSAYRFFIEFFRENWVFYGSLSAAQVYSLVILAVGIVLYIWRSSDAARRRE